MPGTPTPTCVTAPANGVAEFFHVCRALFARSSAPSLKPRIDQSDEPIEAAWLDEVSVEACPLGAQTFL